MSMWRKGRHKKPYDRGWLWISVMPINTNELGKNSLGGVSTGPEAKSFPQYMAVVQGTYRRGMVSKITGKPLVPVIDGILPSQLRGRKRIVAKSMQA